MPCDIKLLGRAALAGAAMLCGAAGWQSRAFAGSDSSTNTWAGDFHLIALPAGSFATIQYFATEQANQFVPNSNNLLGTKQIPANVVVGGEATRLAYVTSFFGHPLAFDSAFPAAAVENANIGGPVSSTSGYGDTQLALHYGLIVDPKGERYIVVTDWNYIPTGNYNKFASINLNSPGQYTNVVQLAVEEGLAKYGLPGFEVDLYGNASFHGDGSAPVAVAAGVQYNNLTQDNSYDLKAFLRYNFGPAAWVAAGVERSLGGNQIASGGVLGSGFPFPGPKSLGTDDYTMLHLQGGVVVRPDVHIAFDYSHDFYVNGGLKVEDAFTLRFTKLWLPEQPLK